LIHELISRISKNPTFRGCKVFPEFPTETRTKIDLGENFGSSQLIKKNIDAGKRIFVLDGYCIERSVVNTQPQTTIFLFDKESGTTPRRRTWGNVALI
jgi:hypothetical protein